MLLAVFAGSEEFFFANINDGQEKVPIPDVGEVVNNPMKGLCWVLQNLLVKGGSMDRNPCRKTGQEPPPPPPPPPTDVILRDLQEQMGKVVRDQQLLNAQMVRMQGGQPPPADVAEKPRTGETPAPADTATPPDTGTSEDTAPLKLPTETPQKPPKK
jgi:hypothetical protein